MSFLDPFKSFFQSLSSLLQSQYALLILGALALLLAATITYAFGWGTALFASPWFWVFIAVLIAAGIFAAVRWGLPWWQERRFVGKEGSEYVAAGQASPEEFQAKFLASLQTLQSLPQLRGKADPLYALPWYLLIGEGGAGKTVALQKADQFSSVLPLPEGGGATQNCDWWVSNTAVVLDTSGRYAAPVDMARDRAEWYRLLRLLRAHREQEPINGLVVAIPADKLALQSSDEQLRAEASKLRERIEEAVKELGVDFPIYLLVTKCDLVEGFNDFFAQLPERVLREAIGYVDAPAAAQDGNQAPRGKETLRRLESGWQSIYDRFLIFRLSILEGKAPEALRPAIFCVPEEFKALQRPLAIFAETLFSEDVRYHTPLFRGVFLASAQQQGATFSLLRRQLALTEEPPPQERQSRPHFLYDLFDTILPRDRSLARLTERARRRRRLTQGSGVFIAAGLGLFLVLLLVRGFILDRRIASTVDSAACPETVQKASVKPRLDEAQKCWQAVQNLVAQNRQRSSWATVLFRRSRSLETELRQRYLQHFQTTVLTPLNSTLDRSLQTSTEPLPLMLILAQRIQLGQRCVSPAGCPEPIPPELQPDYALMLDPQRDRRPAPQDVTKLRETYTAYLLWQPDPKDALRQNLVEDHKRLERGLAGKQFNPDQLLVWVNKRSPPITYETYWELPAPLTTVAPPRIDPACTRQVWERDIASFFQQIQDAVPEAAQRLRTFQQQHLSTCLTQWQRFLAGFPQGAERWKGADRQRTLALRLLTEDSPYRRVIADAATNLTPWLPAEPDAAPAWATQLTTFPASDQGKAYDQALTKISGRLDRDSLSESCFKLAQEAFTEKEPKPEAANPVLQAWGVAAQAGGAEKKPDEDIWGSLLRGPVHYVWRFILAEAGQHIQKIWTVQVTSPLKGLPPAEQVAQLYGPGGKVDGFVQQFLRPFLGGEEAGVSSMLGESVPLAPRFLQMLNDAQRLKPVLQGESGPQPVQIKAAKRSTIGGSSPVVEEQTELSVSCAAKTYRVTSTPPSTAATVMWSYQGCGDVILTIYFSEGGYGTGRVRLTKRYTGQTGFLNFLQDFRTGSHRFQINDFPEGDPEARELLRDGVHTIQVYFQVNVPPSLEKLASALSASPMQIIP